MVIAGLVPATPKRMARRLLIEMAGTSPAMTRVVRKAERKLL
jgi:hypothetical protein